jgi:PIN domain nuclease of toxin-antitoxin system
MRLLLDTHALLWWFTDDDRLSERARKLIGDLDNEILVSAASAWDIATKHRLGKLDEAADAVIRFEELVAADGFTPLAVTQRHGLRAGTYRTPHRDPFDRMLAAQAEIEALPLLTLDPAFRQFEITTLW